MMGMRKSNLNLKLKNMALWALTPILFPNLSCDFNNAIVAEDLHSFQITKEVIDCIMKIRLLRCGRYFTGMTMEKGKSGLREKLNKTVLFQGLWKYGCRSRVWPGNSLQPNGSFKAAHLIKSYQFNLHAYTIHPSVFVVYLSLLNPTLRR